MVDLLQSDGWERFQCALGRTTHRVGGMLVIAMPLPFGLSYLYAPRTNGAWSMEHGALLNIVRTTRAVFLRLEVNSQLSTINYQLSIPRTLRRAVDPEWTWRTSLDGSDDERLTRMREKHRYNVRLAERRGVRVSPHAGASVSREQIATCWNLLQETARRQGIATHPRPYYEVMLRDLPWTTLYFAEREGVAIASAIVAYNDDTATYLHGGSANEHRQHMAPHLLHWAAMNDAKAAGMRWYEWGGIQPPAASRQPPVTDWSGLTRFKQGFGGEVVHHPPTRDLVFRRGWYTMLSVLARLRG